MAGPSSAAEPSAKPRRASLKVLWVPALALVLALAVWASTPRLGALAPYDLEVVSPPSPGRARQAPDHLPAAPVELGEGAELSVLLRPRTTDTESVEASVLLQPSSAGQPLAPVPARTLVVGPGALRVTLSGATLPEAGRLLVLVGRSGLLPGNPVGTASRGRDWQRFDLEFTSRPPAAR